MGHALRWLVIVGLTALIFAYSAYSGRSVDGTGASDDWRETGGKGAILVSVILYLFFRLRSGAKRVPTISQYGPTTNVVFSGAAIEFVPMVFPMIGGAVGSYLLLSQEVRSVWTLLFAGAGICLALVTSLVVLMYLVYGRIRLSLSDEGLDYSPFKCGPIAWQDIKGVDVRRFLSSDLISLELMEPEKYFARGFPKTGHNIGRHVKAFSSPFVIAPKQLQATSDSILGAINVRLAVFGGAPDTKETV